MTYTIISKETFPFSDQKPGTSGLRKTTKTFLQTNYTENYLQAIFNTLKGRIELGGVTLVVGGDGRYHNKYVIEKILIPMAAANRIAKLIIGLNGLLSTPAASHLIRKYGADGGIILTASHNPGGLNFDFGIKFNLSNGGPCTDKVSNELYNETLQISSYVTVLESMEIDLSEVQNKSYIISENIFTIIVVDSVEQYCKYLKKIFDFQSLLKMLTGDDGLPPMLVIADAMHGVMGPYVRRILGDELKVPFDNMIHCDPLEDFGSNHPDPNLTYARNLVEIMTESTFDFGCAFDGDGDRNMILGSKGFFVSPSDSLAVIADNLKIIPYFKRKGIQGFARSMPTSRAVDRVAQKHGIMLHEVPTGWKFFGNLMDTYQISLCGEESFGMGSNHIREKDGLWSVLAWLSVLSFLRHKEHKLISVESVIESHWKRFGRNFYTRYDYEACKSEDGDEIMKILQKLIRQPTTVGRAYKSGEKEYKIKLCNNFTYLDLVDETTSTNQGVQFTFMDDSRIIFRLSGTGSQGSTVRIYAETYESDPSKIKVGQSEKLKPLIDVALEICQIQSVTGRNNPTVIT